MRKIYTSFFLVIFIISYPTNSQAQNYLGAGNSTGIAVRTSSDYKDPNWPETSAGINTVNDQGMLVDYFEAHRFLTQASLGFDTNDVNAVMSMGIEGWIDDQINNTTTSYMADAVDEVFQIIKDSIDFYNSSLPPNEQIEYPRRPNWGDFNYAWWHTNSMNEDLLRHKVAAALTEILVISRLSDISGYGDGMATYYDLLLDGAFGNYEDLLYNVTLSPMMGFYLSHLNNPKSDPANDIHPDENFAREIMQLFSIGLYELNMNGTRKQQGGNDIPTYDNDDIKEYAKVFTGLGVGDLLDHLKDTIVGNWDDEVYFGHGLWVADVQIPMRMWDTDIPGTWRDEDQHEDGPKYLLNTTLPAGQSGLKDVQDAVGDLFHHDNVAPFISLRLIQRLVKSNPSPQYIQAVAQKFVNDGTGTRGNMAAVVKEILIHPEARACSYQMDDTNSKLKEPLFRYTQFARMMDKSNPLGLNWNINNNFRDEAGQDILASPSVFNFFLYDDSPNGPINDQGLVAPEFKIHDSRTSVGYMNNAYRWTISRDIMTQWDFNYPNNYVHWDINNLIPLAKDPESYLNWIDKHVLGGQMSDRTRHIIRTAVNGYYPGAWNWEERRITLGMYLALVAPEYSVMR